MNFFARLLRLLFGERSGRTSNVPASTGFTTSRSEASGSPGAASSPAGRRPQAVPVTGPSIPEPSADPYFAPSNAPELKATPKKSLGLDAAAYAPITREEIKKSAKGQNLFASAWFGRRDLIPPADDPRTKLIDRAMVTQGLLSPEDLHEIHEIGAEMDRIRPTIASVEHQAAVTGQAAVQADRDARARLKAQKKAEAVERKLRRAESIAHRKRTEISFLGRGVSERLGDHRANPALLANAGLPVMTTPGELAATLGITVSKLRWLAFHNEVASRIHYVQFEVAKKSGGKRTLSAPHKDLARCQRWILEAILNKLAVEDPAHGFVASRNIVTNARPHCRRAVVVNMDLEGFFPSIGFPRIRSLFQRLGYSPSVATVLALLCTECPRKLANYEGKTYFVATGPRCLPQGACTSPALSNQVARRLDKRLSGLSAKLGINYTRYADDLTFSGDEVLGTRVGYVMARVRHIAEAEGFAVNEKKSRVLRSNAAQVVTGLVVNDRPGVARSDVRRLRAILHKAKLEGLAVQNREGHPHYLAWLYGKIGFVEMVRPEVGAKLRSELNALLS